MKRRLLAFVTFSAPILLTAGAGVALAHHSVSATYITGKEVRIEGTLKEFIWIIEGAAPQQLTESGLSATTLRPGDQVVVTGRPGRIAEDHKLLLHTIERPSDGFKWAGPNNPQ